MSAHLPSVWPEIDSSRMNVLHFYKTYYPDSFGGVEQVIFQIAEGLAPAGVNTTVLSTSERGNSVQPIGKHRSITCARDFQLLSTAFSISSIGKLRQLAKDADIVHYHYPWPFMDLVHLLDGIDKPTVLTYHSDIVRQKIALQFYRPLQSSFLKRMDRIVAASPNYLASSETLQKYQQKTSVIPIGLDEETYPKPTTGTVEMWRSTYPDGFFLFIGMLRYYKGLDILLRAAQGSNYPILILGDGPLRNELENQARVLGLSNVHFLGALPDSDKTALLSLCRALVFPSNARSEAFGISLVEASMHGKPMICCEIGTGTTYINQHQVTGLVVPPDSPEQLRQAMDTLWDSPELQSIYGKSARTRFEQIFTAQDMAMRYLALYRELLR